MKSVTKSVIQNKRECIICGNWTCEEHHIFNDKLQLSEKHGLKVWLCKIHRQNLNSTFGGSGQKLDLALKQLGQKAFEWKHTREEFIEHFDKSYL